MKTITISAVITIKTCRELVLASVENLPLVNPTTLHHLRKKSFKVIPHRQKTAAKACPILPANRLIAAAQRCPVLIEIGICRYTSVNLPNVKFNKNPFRHFRRVTCGQTYMTKLIRRISATFR